MPELPEVEALARYLTEQAAGQLVTRAELAAISALKTYDPPLAAVVGRTFAGATRNGKYIQLNLSAPDSPLWLVIHLARGGWVRWSDALAPGRAKPGRGPLALRLGFSDGGGIDVTEAGTEKRLAVWIVPDPVAIEHVAGLGPDPLAESFDAAALAAILARAGRTQLKKALTDQSLIAGVGNAYSDEALHRARLSPFKPASGMDEAEVTRLRDAIVAVLTEAVTRSAGLPAKGLKADKKEGLRVHGRAGQACPECGDTIREVSFATKSLQYCPTCQTGGKPLADRRLSRLLK